MQNQLAIVWFVEIIYTYCMNRWKKHNNSCPCPVCRAPNLGKDGATADTIYLIINLELQGIDISILIILISMRMMKMRKMRMKNTMKMRIIIIRITKALDNLL